ncbi:beta-ketoacyl synthase N-terminal-like domain-containing protein [Haliscomenobacter sp.]|uniref:beta-ketoacyl synthase N-terminal-like domain-containing protein n=1 Tax=Haliscomenobacter sp. TaxID=2717303 RepID=UPI003364CF7F
MGKNKIGITGWGSISALGFDPWGSYQQLERHYLVQDAYGHWMGRLPVAAESRIIKMCSSDKYYFQVDRSVLLAITAAEQALTRAGWQAGPGLGIQIGSSRGATNTWEHYYQQWEGGIEGGLSPMTSPLTTLGNLSSWVGYHLRSGDMVAEHSVTCSTALHAILSGVTWLESGRVTRYLAGGTEAPLTPFTIAQMKALRIMAGVDDYDYPVRALDLEKTANTMAIGEGAACFCMEKEPSEALAWIEGIGFSTEWGGTPTNVSKDADGMQRAMRMAWEEAGCPKVDAIVTHAPGTKQGDAAEMKAIQAVFGEDLPLITNNKWKIGHTLGASGGLSLEFALLMLMNDRFIGIPYLAAASAANRPLETMLVNAQGFGGNAVSILLRKGNKY